MTDTLEPIHIEIEREERKSELDQEILLQQEQEANLNSQIDAEKQNRYQGKKILLAAEKGNLLDLVHLIYKNPELVNFNDPDGYTPLHRASYGDHKDCVKYLLNHGANLEARTADSWTPLHCAVRWNNIAVAEYLVQRGANVNAKSSGGNTPLHIVVSNGRYSITCDIIQLLLFHPDCDHTIKNDSGDSAYDIAKRSGPFFKLWCGVDTLFLDPNEER